MSWVGILKLLLTLTVVVVNHMREKKLLDSDRAQQLLRQLEESNAILAKAAEARSRAERDFDERGGVPNESDPNLRD